MLKFIGNRQMSERCSKQMFIEEEYNMRNKELKQTIKELKTTPVSMLWGSEIKRLKQYERWLKADDITVVFSDIINTYFNKKPIIEITNQPLDYSYIQCAYDRDGYRIEWRNEQKLHIIGTTKKEFKYLKNKFELKDI
jgi:hypothetical protein